MQNEKEINLKSLGGYHFGKLIDITNLVGSYFEKNNVKVTIISILYNPDNIYSTTDGYAGNCWTAKMQYTNEPTIYKLNFRNSNDLFAHYENEKFIYNH
jgi:hypothetical protein